MAPSTVRFDMPCGKCDKLLPAGTSGLWDRGLGRMTCVACPTNTPVSDPSEFNAGVAGRSARVEHTRRVAKREADLKARWGDRVGGWVNKLSDEPGSTRSWATGAVGEEKLGALLDGLEGVIALHDRGVPGKRTNIDHIAFASAGIFVIDTKHYQGQVEVRRKGSFFHPEDRLYVGRWDRTEDIDGVRSQVAVVEAALLSSDVQPKPPVTPVLCFTRAGWPLVGAAKSFRGVYLESARSIKNLVKASSDFSLDEMARIRTAIAEALPAR